MGPVITSPLISAKNIDMLLIEAYLIPRTVESLSYIYIYIYMSVPLVIVDFSFLSYKSKMQFECNFQITRSIIVNLCNTAEVPVPVAKVLVFQHVCLYEQMSCYNDTSIVCSENENCNAKKSVSPIV